MIIVLSLLCSSHVHGAISITSYGAISDNTSLAVSIANGRALYLALQAANRGSFANDTRRVIVPAGGNFSMLPFNSSNSLTDVTLQLDGMIWAWSGNRTAWPGCAAGGCLNLLQFNDCTRLTLNGSGVIEGNGDPWCV